MFDPNDLLSLESRAARVAAVLDARPDLGALWRRMVALSEAAASMSLENMMIPESDIMRPALGLGPARGEPQSARTAESIHRVMLRTGSLWADPEGVFTRCVEAARMTDLVDVEDGGRVDYLTDDEVANWDIGGRRFAEAARRVLRRRGPVSLISLSVARLAADCMPDRQPIAERLVFMAAESALRQETTFSDPIISRRLEGFDTKVSAGWVMTPSLALSRGGFRAWSPYSSTGWSALIERLSVAISREAGRLGRVNDWSERLERDFRGRSGKSKREAFATLIREMPILNAETVARELGITPRGGRKLISEAHEMGLVACLTDARAYRLWAPPVLAEMIADRGRIAPPSQRNASLPPARERESFDPPPGLVDDNAFEARVGAIMSEIDSAMAGLDGVLDRYRERRSDS